jgi:hypothetical protein
LGLNPSILWHWGIGRAAGEAVLNEMPKNVHKKNHPLYSLKPDNSQISKEIRRRRQKNIKGNVQKDLFIFISFFVFSAITCNNNYEALYRKKIANKGKNSTFLTDRVKTKREVCRR